MNDLLFGSAVGMAAFLAAIGVVLCVGVVLHLGKDREYGLIPYIFYPAIFVAVLGVLLSGRNLHLPLESVFAASSKHPLVAWASRATSLFLLVAAGERIGKRFVQYGRKPDTPTPLVIAFWSYFLTNVVSSALFGTYPWFSHEYLYVALAGYAALLATQAEGNTAIRSARNALFVFLVVSALCIAWRPEMVFWRDYEGLIPWLTLRYAGLSTHPNTLGPMVIVFLLCLWKSPYSARLSNLLGWTIGCASLLFAQSKTSWIAFVLCAVVFAYFRHGGSLAQRSFDFRRPLLLGSFLLLAMLTTCVIGVVFMFGGAGEIVAGFFETRLGAGLLTLTGRDQIWDVAVQEWRSNPLFGYGLTLWNDDYRAQIGMPLAFHAHNQLYQSLASAGIIGVAGLAIYAVALFWFVLKTTKASQGLTLALFTLLLIQSISEVPLSMTSGYAPVQFTHLLLLVVLASQLASSHAERVGAKRSPRYGLISS